MLSLDLIAQRETRPAAEKNVAASFKDALPAAQQEPAAPARPLATFAERVISGPSEQWI